MNGWMRIWVVCSVIWSIGVLTTKASSLPDRNGIEVSDGFYYEDESVTDLFFDYQWVVEEKILKITKIPVSDEAGLTVLENRIQEIFSQQNLPISRESLRDLVEQVQNKRTEGRRINPDYLRYLETTNANSVRKWWEGVMEICFLVIGVPTTALISGYIVNWIREGF